MNPQNNPDAPGAAPGPQPPDLDMAPASTPAGSVVRPGAPAPMAPETPGLPEASPAPVPADAVPAPIKPPKRKKWKMLALITGIVVLVLGGGAAAAYFGYYLPNKPDNILNQALAATFSKDVQSVAFKGEFDITPTDEDAAPTSASFEGAVSSNSFTLNATVDLFITNLTLDILSPDGKTLYVRAGGLAGLPEILAQSEQEVAATYATAIAAVDGQWLEINESLLNEWAGDSGQAAATPALSEEDYRKIATAYQEHMFLKVSETLPDAQAGGVDSYHYKVVVNEAEFKAFLEAVRAAKITGVDLSGEEWQNVLDQIGQADFSKYPLNVWIAKDTKRFSQLGYSYSDSEATLTFTMTLTDYNKPVEVEKPAGSKSILEVLGGLFSLDPTSLESLQEQLPDQLNNGVSL